MSNHYEVTKLRFRLKRAMYAYEKRTSRDKKEEYESNIYQRYLVSTFLCSAYANGIMTKKQIESMFPTIALRSGLESVSQDILLSALYTEQTKQSNTILSENFITH